MQLGRLQANWKRITDAGGTVIGVSVDDPAKSRELRAQFHLQFPLLTDADFTVIKAWGVEDDEIPAPSVFLLDPQGVVIWGSIGMQPFETDMIAAMEGLSSPH